MEEIDTENYRLNGLSGAIEQLFGELGPDDVDELRIKYSETITEMFEVTAIVGGQAELKHLFDDYIFSPAKLPYNLLPLIRTRDTFLMTIGLKGDEWHVIYMSPPYFESGF